MTAKKLLPAGGAAADCRRTGDHLPRHVSAAGGGGVAGGNHTAGQNLRFLCQRYIVKVKPYFETHRKYDWHSFLQVVEGAQILTEEQAEQLLRLQHQEQPEEPQEILQEVQEVRLTLF